MDKKYYSKKHKNYRNTRAYSRNRKNKSQKSPFLMRLNISLGIAIIVVGIYKLDNNFSKSMATTYKNIVSENISFAKIKNDFNNIVDFKSISAFTSGNKNFITLNQSVIDYINDAEDTYTVNNQEAVAP